MRRLAEGADGVAVLWIGRKQGEGASDAVTASAAAVVAVVVAAAQTKTQMKTGAAAESCCARRRARYRFRPRRSVLPWQHPPPSRCES